MAMHRVIGRSTPVAALVACAACALILMGPSTRTHAAGSPAPVSCVEAPWVDAAPDAVRPKLDRYLEFRGHPQTVDISLVSDYRQIPVPAATLDRVLALIDPDKVQAVVDGSFIRAELDGAAALRIAALPEVHGIAPPRVAHFALHDAVEIVGAVQTWDIAVEGVPLTGQGYSIVLIDSGLDWSHPDIPPSKNIVGYQLYCPDELRTTPPFCVVDPLQDDPVGHGTHVAGIAAGQGTINGIGKGLNIIMLRLSAVTTLDIHNALVWARDHIDEYNVKAISMSLASYATYDDYTNLGVVEARIAEIVDSYNVPVLIATGNEGVASGIGWPASSEYAIPVAATRKDDAPWASSNYNWMVKLFAPGADILSSCAFDGAPEPPGPLYCSASGTSMSTPMVAAAMAIMGQYLQAVGVALTPFELEQMLFDTGDPIVGLPFTDWRRINIHSAMLALIEQYGSAPGACCVDGGCVENTEAGCMAAGGVYQGDGSACGVGGCSIACSADLTGPAGGTPDGNVDALDFLLLIGQWGTPCSGACDADITGPAAGAPDGAVDALDFLLLMAQWGAPGNC